MRKTIRPILFFSYLLSLLPGSILATESLIPENLVQQHKGYLAKEQQLIQDDLNNIRKKLFRNVVPPKKNEAIYVATAGVPGASKTTILENYLSTHPNYVYCDPDQRALRFMINTYLESLSNLEISRGTSEEGVRRAAYEKWRAASNYIANTLINEAFANRYNIAHGTTSTVEAINKLYMKLKAEKYKIILLVCISPDDNRFKALKYRDEKQALYQITPEEAVSKGQMAFHRFPTYFQYADELHLLWVEDFKKAPVEAGVFIKDQGFTQTNAKALESIQQLYDQERNNQKGKMDLPEFATFITKK